MVNRRAKSQETLRRSFLQLLAISEEYCANEDCRGSHDRGSDQLPTQDPEASATLPVSILDTRHSGRNDNTFSYTEVP